MRTNRIDDAHNSRGGQYLLLRTNRKRTVRGAHKTRDSCIFVAIVESFMFNSFMDKPMSETTSEEGKRTPVAKVTNASIWVKVGADKAVILLCN